MAFDKNKIHLVPIMVQDLVHNFNHTDNKNQKDILAERLEVIRDYIITNLENGNKKK